VVRVAAPPEGGRANEALLKLLSRAWGLPRSDLSVARGAQARRKSLQLSGDPARLLPALEAWLADLEGG